MLFLSLVNFSHTVICSVVLKLINSSARPVLQQTFTFILRDVGTSVI